MNYLGRRKNFTVKGFCNIVFLMPIVCIITTIMIILSSKDTVVYEGPYHGISCCGFFLSSQEASSYGTMLCEEPGKVMCKEEFCDKRKGKNNKTWGLKCY